MRRSVSTETDGARGPLPVRVAVAGLKASDVAAAVEAARDAFRAHAGSEIEKTDQRDLFRNAFNEIEARLAVATERCAPRTELPKRLARFSFLAPVMLGAYNYVSKSQREAIMEQTIALGSLVAVLRLLVKAYDD